MKKKILFICVHNSARSQMAAAFVNQLCQNDFEAQSAGLKPGALNPFVVESLREVGIDISQNKPQEVFEVWKSGTLFQYVITVCSEADAEGCPIFPGRATRLHWPFDDPSKFIGTHPERLAQTGRVRDQIRQRIEIFCAEHRGELAASPTPRA
ncbi:MAG: arsenate reductase ArsC [Chthoniobacterales bacterium]